MKYVIFIGDGMGDYPIDSLDGLTPLEAAPTPNLDWMAQGGITGRLATIPEGMTPGSDVAIMSLMGYNPQGILTGRGPLEALALKVPLAEDDLAFRLNLVTLSHDPELVIINHAAGDITNAEAKPLIEELNKKLPLTNGQKIYQGISYRHLFVWPNAPDSLPSIPPHDQLDKPLTPFIEAKEMAPLTALIRASWPILDSHPVNLDRAARNLPTANSIWLWAQGRPPKVNSYSQRWALTGVTVSAVDIIKGLGLATGLTPLTVEGATGGLQTNYLGKAQAAISALKDNYDLAIVHLEAPDETSHHGNLNQKLKAIENFDSLIVGPILDYLKASGSDFKILAACDHFTPLSLKTHSTDPVPFIIYDSRKSTRSGAQGYGERASAATGLFVSGGLELSRLFFGPEQTSITPY
ncbi:MAG: cofactor-independent phosphoglycerate mutase [Deltaproteobacteria bacterium]|jgi:2,3-bisphosphoglycerate-independent phosphoglycerate mutase|nr:cofactor-independent phosphoglycerate mutase [Deltaproteobacteria bacterium]